MNKQFYSFLGIAALGFISGCQSLPWHLAPDDLSETKKNVPGQYVMDQAGEAIQSHWWKEFQSDELTNLIDRAYEQNLDLVVAWARLREAAAMAQRTESDQKLSVEGSSSASTRVDHVKSDKDSSNSFSMGLSAGYEIDLWGRLNAATASSNASFEATKFDLMATRQLIAQQVADAWITIKTNQELEALLNSQLKANNDRLSFLKERQRKGISNIVDVLQQNQQVASVISSLTPVRKNIQLQKNRLALLLGVSASELPEISITSLPELPELPGTGLPTELLVNRPDILSAWQAVEASNWDLVVARADRLPSLNLTGSVSTTSPEIHNLFDNWAENLAASMVTPLIDGGRRKAEIARVEAQLKRFIANYRTTVLEAVKEVDDALVGEQYEKEYLQKVQIELDYAKKTLTETTRRYRKGGDSYLSVLIALNTKHQTERDYINSRGQLLIERIALYKALGSGINESEIEGITEYDN